MVRSLGVIAVRYRGPEQVGARPVPALPVGRQLRGDHASIVSTARKMWIVYLSLTALFTVIIFAFTGYLSGIPSTS
ncbi:MAG: hypothetical protein LUO93_05545 [Methanomicrobiales archaeon]|nr:hypothetical protein [Methanomicrobiales archaeon]